MALSPLLLAPLRLPAKALDGLPGLAPSTNPEPYVTGLRGGAPPGPRHQERKRAGLPSRRHYRFSKQRRQVYEPGGALRVKVRRKLRNWFSAGASLEVLKWIKHGVRIEWKEGKRPAPFHQGRSFAGVSPEERAFVLSEVDRLLDSGAIRVAEPGEATHVSKALCQVLFFLMRQVPFGSCVPCADRNKNIIYPHMTEICGYSLVTVFLMKVR